MKTIPRIDYEYVQNIMACPELPLEEKAKQIHSYDYSMACRETDGRLPELMTESEIFNILLELAR